MGVKPSTSEVRDASCCCATGRDSGLLLRGSCEAHAGYVSEGVNGGQRRGDALALGHWLTWRSPNSIAAIGSVNSGDRPFDTFGPGRAGLFGAGAGFGFGMRA